jgi:hypothetical protein
MTRPGVPGTTRRSASGPVRSSTGAVPALNVLRFKIY